MTVFLLNIFPQTFQTTCDNSEFSFFCNLNCKALREENKALPTRKEMTKDPPRNYKFNYFFHYEFKQIYTTEAIPSIFNKPWKFHVTERRTTTMMNFAINMVRCAIKQMQFS